MSLEVTGGQFDIKNKQALQLNATKLPMRVYLGMQRETNKL